MEATDLTGQHEEQKRNKTEMTLKESRLQVKIRESCSTKTPEELHAVCGDVTSASVESIVHHIATNSKQCIRCAAVHLSGSSLTIVRSNYSKSKPGCSTSHMIASRSVSILSGQLSDQHNIIQLPQTIQTLS